MRRYYPPIYAGTKDTLEYRDAIDNPLETDDDIEKYIESKRCEFYAEWFQYLDEASQ